MNSLTIAIPAYNEEGSIAQVVSEAISYAQEVLVVDDGSTDRTRERIPKNRKVKIIIHPINQGFSGAIRSCYRHATKKLIFLLPADGQIKPADCALFLKKIDTADVVVGYRKNNPEPFMRRLNSWVFHTIYRTLFGVPLKEISTSILWRKKVLDSIRITASPRSALIEPEVVYKAWVAGWKITDVAVPYYTRKTGVPKGANPFMIIITIRELLRLWLQTRAPHHTIT